MLSLGVAVVKICNRIRRHGAAVAATKHRSVGRSTGGPIGAGRVRSKSGHRFRDVGRRGRAQVGHAANVRHGHGGSQVHAGAGYSRTGVSDGRTSHVSIG